MLRACIAKVKKAHPFIIHSWVVLPDHFHCVIELPEGDVDFAMQLRLIKFTFSKVLPKLEFQYDVRKARGERGIWQSRYWEHLIKNEADYRTYVDYVHINPVMHGLVVCVKNWPFSTFHALLEQGIDDQDWGQRHARCFD